MQVSKVYNKSVVIDKIINSVYIIKSVPRLRKSNCNRYMYLYLFIVTVTFCSNMGVRKLWKKALYLFPIKLQFCSYLKY